MVVNQERFHLKGVGQNITDDDLQKFCSRLGSVCELYRPTSLTATNLPKDFAIVKVEGDSEARAKAAKALNGSLWKGCKIRISQAKEYYKDRLSRERNELEETQLLRKTEKPIIPSNTRNFQALTIRIRKGRGLPAMKVASSPKLFVNGSLFQNSSHPLSRAATKTLFELPSDFIPPEGYKLQPHEEISFSRKVAEPVQETKTNDTKKVSGKGVRRGFGTLMEVDCCIEEKDEENHQSINSWNDQNDEQDVANYPVTEAELVNEKERSLSILSKLLNSTPSKELDPITVTSKMESQPELSSESKQNVYVNIKEMKSIFSKSGGVWWNEGTVERRGEAANDIIFAEAERQGFDIRSGLQDTQVDKKRAFTLFSSEDDQEEEKKPKLLRLEADTKPVNRGILLEFNQATITDLAKEFYCNRDTVGVIQEWRESRESKVKLFKQRRRDFSRQVSKR